MCHWDSVIFEELVPHLNRCPKICSLLFTFVHFFVLKELVPRLNRHPKTCSLLFTFIFSKISKGAVPRLNSGSIFCSFSVHFCSFCRVDLVNLRNLLVYMNPSPGPGPGEKCNFSPKLMKNHEKSWKIAKTHEKLPTNGVCISLRTRRRVLQMIFWDSRDIIQVAKKNLDEKYFFIMEKIDFKNFEILLFLRFLGIFFWILPFLASHNFSSIFDFGPADPHKVPRWYPTQHFLESWASGEHIPSLVCHHRDSFRPLPGRFLKSTGHHSRRFLKPLPVSKTGFFNIAFKRGWETPFFHFGFRFACLKGIFFVETFWKFWPPPLNYEIRRTYFW